MKTDDILAMLRVFKRTAAEKYDITRIGVFGSFARGETDEESDVDIVFETNSPNLFRTARMKAELTSLLCRPADVVRFRANMNPRLKSRIVREAKYVCMVSCGGSLGPHVECAGKNYEALYPYPND